FPMRVVARMTSDGQPSNSYDYLRTLRPEAWAMQAAELERGVLAGEESPRNALILQELRRTIPRAPPPAARMGPVARMFLRRSSRSSSTMRWITSALGALLGYRSSPCGVDRARSDAGGYQGAAHRYRTRASHQRPGQGRTAHRTLHDRAILRTRE